MSEMWAGKMKANRPKKAGKLKKGAWEKALRGTTFDTDERDANILSKSVGTFCLLSECTNQTCKSKNYTKAGRNIDRQGTWQMVVCKTCGRRQKSHLIEPARV